MVVSKREGLNSVVTKYIHIAVTMERSGSDYNMGLA